MEYLGVFAFICQMAVLGCAENMRNWWWVKKIPIKDNTKEMIFLVGAPILLTYIVGKIFGVRGIDYAALQLLYVYIFITAIIIICKIYCYVKKVKKSGE
jgi:hypothetical protein